MNKFILFIYLNEIVAKELMNVAVLVEEVRRESGNDSLMAECFFFL